jgi:pimeloyl-ACP methyl ester carboxylesterase
VHTTEPSSDPSAPGAALPRPAPTPAARTLLESRWSDVDGVRVHTVAGGEGPPVVLVHGYGVSGTYMLPLARTLARSFSVFVPDLPGQGKSGDPRGPWGMREMAQALGAWLDGMGISAPVVVANSMGCQIVTELAVRRPDAVGPMVLVGPTVDPARRAARHQLFGMLRELVREPSSLVGVAARNTVAVDGRLLLRTARAVLSDQIEARLPLIAQPTVVVYGDQDGFVSREWAEGAASLLPRGRVVAVPGEPHAVHYTRPALVAEIVGELFVEKGEHARGELAGRLEHRDVPAREAYDLGPRQEPLPVFR